MWCGCGGGGRGEVVVEEVQRWCGGGVESGGMYLICSYSCRVFVFGFGNILLPAAFSRGKS